MGSPATVLSPHLDDAVLSCWHVLAGPDDVRVVNVFAGLPEAGAPLAWWDRVTGADDSRERMSERFEEDRAALALAEREAVNLDLLDMQYRANGRTPAVLEEVVEHLPEGGIVYAPAALGLHGDHRLVMAAGLTLERRGFDVRFYADLPHATTLGWPAWVTGEEPDPHFDVDAVWENLSLGNGLDLRPRAAAVHRLDDAAWRSKLEALRSYETQLSGIVREAPLELLRHEVVWSRR